MINVTFSFTYFPAIAQFASDLSEDEQEDRVAAYFQLSSICSAQHLLWGWQLICPFKSIDHKEQRKWAQFAGRDLAKHPPRWRGQCKPQRRFKNIDVRKGVISGVLPGHVLRSWLTKSSLWLVHFFLLYADYMLLLARGSSSGIPHGCMFPGSCASCTFFDFKFF